MTNKKQKTWKISYYGIEGRIQMTIIKSLDNIVEGVKQK